MTGITKISTPVNLALWSSAFNELEKGGFTSDDVEYIESTKGRLSHEYLAACALHRLSEHDHVEGDENKVRAVLLAAKTWRNSAMISPADVFAIADNFACYYGERDDALDEHLREFWNDMPITYLSDYGREELLKGMRRNNEIWVESDKFTGLYVFNHPDVKP